MIELLDPALEPHLLQDWTDYEQRVTASAVDDAPGAVAIFLQEVDREWRLGLRKERDIGRQEYITVAEAVAQTRTAMGESWGIWKKIVEQAPPDLKEYLNQFDTGENIRAGVTKMRKGQNCPSWMQYASFNGVPFEDCITNAELFRMCIELFAYNHGEAGLLREVPKCLWGGPRVARNIG